MKKWINFTIFAITWITGMVLLAQSAAAYDFYTYGGLSYEYNKVDQYCDPDKDWFVANIGSGIEQDISFMTFFAEAELETEMYYSYESMTGVGFAPTHQDYYVRGGITAGAFQIGYEHLCMHNVDCVKRNRNGGYDAVYIRFDSRGF